MIGWFTWVGVKWQTSWINTSSQSSLNSNHTFVLTFYRWKKYPIYPTPPLGQDMTQVQFFKRSLTGLNSEFSLSRSPTIRCSLVSKTGHSFQVSYFSAMMLSGNKEVHTFPRCIKCESEHYSYLPTPSLEQDMTQGQRNLTGLNSEFSFSETSCLTKAEEPTLPYYLAIAGGRIFGFIPFPRVLVLCGMQSVQDLNSCRRVQFLRR